MGFSATNLHFKAVSSVRGTAPVVRDYSYLCWPTHYFADSTRTISSGRVAYWLLKNVEEICDARFSPIY